MKRTSLTIVLMAAVVAAALLWVFPVNRFGQPKQRSVPVPAEGSATNADSHPRSESALVSDRRSPDAASGAPASWRMPGVDLIEEICGPSAYQRLQELSSVGPLTPAECRALAEFVSGPTADESLERMASIKNAVMNVLARQQNLPERWEDLLRRMIEDDGQHAVIRAYALQHMFTRYERWTESGDPDGSGDHELSNVRQFFWRMVDHPEGSVAATALVGLCHLAGDDHGVDPAEIGAKASALLEQSEVDPLVEISALQVAALVGETGVLARALEVAEAGPTVASRVSAVAAVGAVGDNDALPRMKRLLDDPNASVRNAARAAIARLESSHGG